MEAERSCGSASSATEDEAHAPRSRNVVLIRDRPRDRPVKSLGNLLRASPWRRVRRTAAGPLPDDPRGELRRRSVRRPEAAQTLSPESGSPALRDQVLPARRALRRSASRERRAGRSADPRARRGERGHRCPRGTSSAPPASPPWQPPRNSDRLPELEQLLQESRRVGSAPRPERRALKTLIALARQELLAAAKSLKVVLDGLERAPGRHHGPPSLCRRSFAVQAAPRRSPHLRTAVLPIAELIVQHQQTASLGRSGTRRSAGSGATPLADERRDGLAADADEDRTAASQWAVSRLSSPEFRGREPSGGDLAADAGPGGVPHRPRATRSSSSRRCRGTSKSAPGGRRTAGGRSPSSTRPSGSTCSTTEIAPAEPVRPVRVVDRPEGED